MESSPGIELIQVGGIALETRRGTPIPNAQYRELEQPELLRGGNPTRGLDVTVKTEPTGVYNCHGLTFAARRTGIDPDAFDFQRLLEEDCYELVDQERNALPGDVVLYYDSSGKLQHSGMVIAGPENGFGFPRVLSKWGRWGEVIHLAHVVSELYGPTREYRRVVR